MIAFRAILINDQFNKLQICWLLQQDFQVNTELPKNHQHNLESCLFYIRITLYLPSGRWNGGRVVVLPERKMHKKLKSAQSSSLSFFVDVHYPKATLDGRTGASSCIEKRKRKRNMLSRRDMNCKGKIKLNSQYNLLDLIEQ